MTDKTTERRRYRKVHIRMWGDSKFRSLTKLAPSGQALWLRFLTGPETTPIPGVLIANEVGLAAQLRWPLEGLREAFREVSGKGMARADWDAGLVWLPNGIECNSPESPNVILGWRSTWDELPESPLKWEIFHGLKAHVETLKEGWRRAFEGLREPFLEPSPNQDQEQDQEQEEEITTPPQAGALFPLPQKTQKTPAKKRGPIEYEPGYLALWALYPRKDGKAEGHAAWIAAGRPIEPVTAALTWQVPAWAARPDYDPPHFSTYLNKRRWEDEPTKPKTIIGQHGAGTGQREFVRAPADWPKAKTL